MSRTLYLKKSMSPTSPVYKTTFTSEPDKIFATKSAENYEEKYQLRKLTQKLPNLKVHKKVWVLFYIPILK